MKSNAILSLFVLSLALFPSCKDEDKIKPSDVSGTVVNGQWKIVYFVESDSDETGSFTNYNLTFTVTPNTSPATGLVEASNGTTDVVGSWATGYLGDNAKLRLNFGISPFDELSDDWEVIELNSSTIKLKHVSGGNGGTDFLTLELN